uniref:No apical meristem-associated C-terminal domain-containing protein n=1 Tax=Leersia perrieri TaxID=77586 RepID=A0A0D9VEM5_9ORYZ
MRRRRTPPRRHGETGGDVRRRRRRDEIRSSEKKKEKEKAPAPAPPRRVRSEIGEVSGSLRRITGDEILVAEGAATASSPSLPLPPPPPPLLSSHAILFNGGGGQGVGASSSALFHPTVTAAADDNLKSKPLPEAVAPAMPNSSKKRKTVSEFSPTATTTTSSKRTKTKPPCATRFAPIPLPPTSSYDEEAVASEKRKEELLTRFAGTIAKAQNMIGLGKDAAAEELIRREAERAKAREALQKVEDEARRTGGVCAETIRAEHLRELHITGDMEYAVSTAAPPWHSPVASLKRARLEMSLHYA